MKNGIERNNIAREVDRLTNSNLITMSRKEARELSGALPDRADDLSSALDEAQGAQLPEDRYVVIYVEQGDI